MFVATGSVVTVCVATCNAVSHSVSRLVAVSLCVLPLVTRCHRVCRDLQSCHCVFRHL